jgi:hypothetical protein
MQRRTRERCSTRGKEWGDDRERGIIVEKGVYCCGVNNVKNGRKKSGDEVSVVDRRERVMLVFKLQ